MTRHTMDDERFDRAIQELRDENVAPGRIDAARERVWQRLQGAGSRACEELRPALADYARGRLAETRRLLVHDHVSRCLDCRHALAEIQGRGRGEVKAFPARAERRVWVRWAVAASVLLAIAYVGRDSLDAALAPGGPRATVESVSGTLLHLAQGVVQPGAQLHDGEVVRTAAGSHAVLRMADGSRVEMNGRTELDLEGAWSGDTVRLRRGDVVVQAAEQGRRRLRVVTRDSVAAVRGTVFAVSAGAAGSLVSVVEGAVAVSQPGFESLLRAGQQAASNPALASVSFEQALSWSQDADDYYALLADLGAIEERVAALTGAALRYQARLLPYLPDGVMAYIAMPNVDGAMAEALGLLEDRATPGTALDAWLSSEEGREMVHVLESLGAFSSSLGDEIVFTLAVPSPIDDPSPLLIAEVRAGAQEELRRTLEALEADAGESLAYRIDGSLLLISSTPAELADLAGRMSLGAGSQFSMEIEARYREGVAWLAALDLGILQSAVSAESADGASAMRALGLTNARFLLVEQKTTDLGDQTAATVSFDGRRTGVASWLGSPGPLGSAEYLSSGVIFAAAAATREPAEALDQLLDRLGPDSELAATIEEVERETGIRVRDDLAASLGTDVAFGIEQPTFPVPGWVAIAEVYDPVALDASLRRLADSANAHAASGGHGPVLEFRQENVNGRVWSSLTGLGDEDFPGLEWTYHLGYLVAAADRGLALRAIEVRDSGASLVHSGGFDRAFPDGAGVHSSGFVWVDPARLSELAAIAGDGNAALQAAIEGRDPVLVVFSGESARLVGSSRTRLSGLVLNAMLGDLADRSN